MKLITTIWIGIFFLPSKQTVKKKKKSPCWHLEEVVEPQVVLIQSAGDASKPGNPLGFLMLCDVRRLTSVVERAGAGTGGSSRSSVK